MVAFTFSTAGRIVFGAGAATTGICIDREPEMALIGRGTEPARRRECDPVKGVG